MLVSRTRKLDEEGNALFERLLTRPGFVSAEKVSPQQRLLLNQARDGTTLHLVLENGGVRLERGEQTWRSHPGMGMVRLRRVRRGDVDPMLDVTGVRPGDRVLDATFGYGHDSLLLAHAAGESGEVVSLEANPVLAAMGEAGLRHWPSPADEIGRRIRVLHADHREWLKTQPDQSFDVVFFDPMFRRGISAAPGFDLLRVLGEPDPLSEQTLAEAKRVARRIVVVKDAAPGFELQRLGLVRDDRRRSAPVYFGWWRRG